MNFTYVPLTNENIHNTIYALLCRDIPNAYSNLWVLTLYSEVKNLKKLI